MLNNRRRLFALYALLIGLLTTSASAQKLPPPSGTVFKCESDGQVVYSDSPCLGAEKLDIDIGEIEPRNHRMNLASPVRNECERLDVAVPRMEAQEKRATRQSMPEVQRRLYDLRKRFREIGC